jgi:hypothetical protein
MVPGPFNYFSSGTKNLFQEGGDHGQDTDSEISQTF